MILKNGLNVPEDALFLERLKVASEILTMDKKDKDKNRNSFVSRKV